MTHCRLTLLREQVPICQYDVRRADTMIERMRGLLFTKPLQSNEGMIISPCNSVHTIFMSYAIDVVYINKLHRVCHLVSGLTPWRASMHLAASYVLELSAGQIAYSGIRIGDEVQCQNY